MENSSSLGQRIIGISLLSASSLFLEISLTRLFSALYFPPYVFFIISFAILGIGLGAAISALKTSFSQENRLVIYSTAASLSTLVLVIFSVFTASTDLQIVLFALLLIPYIFVGLALSTLFSAYSQASRILYMGDLLGAGLGSILVIVILNAFGTINGLLLAALGFAISGIYFDVQKYRGILFAGIVISTIAFMSNFARDWLKLDIASIATSKPITEVLRTDGEILETSWDSFARTDLVDPGNDRPLQIYVDGGAASIMPGAGENPTLTRDIGFFPFATDQPEQVFIIGPGAGLDVWFALQAGATEVVAVEVNPASVKLVEQYARQNGQVYNQPAVQVITDDGRSVLQGSDASYDLIYLSQVVTLVAERGGYALSENTIYTVEAFENYLAHLTDDGQIALKLYDEITLTRALSTALVALRNQGLSDQDALEHIMIIVDNNASPSIPLLMIKKSAFSEDDSLVLGSIARQVGFEPVHLPHVLVQPSLESIANGLSSFDVIVAASASDISAPTDNRPYFFQFEYGIPQTLMPLSIVIGIISAIGLALYLITAFRTSSVMLRAMPIYFAVLGIGFIAVEIFVIQQTRLFLGHPIFAVTLVLASFLMGGGIGSGLSQRFAKSIQERSPFLLPASVVAILIIWTLIWNALSNQFVANPLIIRATVVLIPLIPLTLVMGTPFAFGLDLIAPEGQRQIAIAWAVNGVTSVIGTVLSVILSILSGFQLVLILAVFAYLIAALILAAIKRFEV